jgi:hypothetical protein
MSRMMSCLVKTLKITLYLYEADNYSDIVANSKLYV